MVTNSNRIQIPLNLIKLSNTDFSKELRLYTDGYEYFIDNPDNNKSIPCFGKINLDAKKRFFLPKSIRIPLRYTDVNNIYFYVLDEKVCLKCRSN